MSGRACCLISHSKKKTIFCHSCATWLCLFHIPKYLCVRMGATSSVVDRSGVATGHSSKILVSPPKVHEDGTHRTTSTSRSNDHTIVGEYSPSKEARHFVKTHNLFKYQEFFCKVKDNVVSINDARIYVKNEPQCLFVTDLYGKTLIQHAHDNNNKMLYFLFIEIKNKSDPSIPEIVEKMTVRLRSLEPLPPIPATRNDDSCAHSACSADSSKDKQNSSLENASKITSTDKVETATPTMSRSGTDSIQGSKRIATSVAENLKEQLEPEEKSDEVVDEVQKDRQIIHHSCITAPVTTENNTITTTESTESNNQ